MNVKGGTSICRSMKDDVARMSPELRRSLADLLADTATSNRKAARGAAVHFSAVTRYLNGEADPRVSTLKGLARTCGARLVLVRGDAASVAESLGSLNDEERSTLMLIARALPTIRGDELVASHVRSFKRYMADRAGLELNDGTPANVQQRRA